MTKENIDKFFDSLSKDVLKKKWSKYSKYSNNVGLSFLGKVFTHNYCDTCGFTKDDTFVTEHYIEAGIIQCSKCINGF